MVFTYQFARPVLTVDALLFLPSPEGMRVVLIERGKEPFKGQLAIPGGHFEVHTDDSLESAARRELHEETGWNHPFELELVGAFDEKDRDPRDRYISMLFCGYAFSGLAQRDRSFIAGDDAQSVVTPRISDIKPNSLAFDHNRMLVRGLGWLVRKGFPEHG